MSTPSLAEAITLLSALAGIPARVAFQAYDLAVNFKTRLGRNPVPTDMGAFCDALAHELGTEPTYRYAYAAIDRWRAVRSCGGGCA